MLAPAALQGNILEGKVNNSKAGGKIGGRSVLSFSFETLGHAGRLYRQPIKQNLWIQDGRVRLYINDQRVVDTNQIQSHEIAYVELRIGLDDIPNSAIGLRTVRFAESASDFSKVIASSGRYVTHGLLFDTDSDRLKPESAPVIKSIARGLETNPNLKRQIEGYTDSTGNAASLMAIGLGAAKPIDSNDTPQGRMQNRRVEFVKQP